MFSSMGVSAEPVFSKKTGPFDDRKIVVLHSCPTDEQTGCGIFKSGDVPGSVSVKLCDCALPGPTLQ